MALVAQEFSGGAVGCSNSEVGGKRAVSRAFWPRGPPALARADSGAVEPGRAHGGWAQTRLCGAGWPGQPPATVIQSWKGALLLAGGVVPGPGAQPCPAVCTETTSHRALNPPLKPHPQ